VDGFLDNPQCKHWEPNSLFQQRDTTIHPVHSAIYLCLVHRKSRHQTEVVFLLVHCWNCDRPSKTKRDRPFNQEQSPFPTKSRSPLSNKTRSPLSPKRSLISQKTRSLFSTQDRASPTKNDRPIQRNKGRSPFPFKPAIALLYSFKKSDLISKPESDRPVPLMRSPLHALITLPHKRSPAMLGLQRGQAGQDS